MKILSKSKYEYKYYKCTDCGNTVPCYCIIQADEPDTCLLGNIASSWIEIDKEQIP